jgi:hypothetical protein
VSPWLTEVFRQADPAHVALLHQVRVGRADREVSVWLDKCRRPLPPAADGVLPTMLYCTRKAGAYTLTLFSST